MRPTAALFPAVCLIAALLGKADTVFGLLTAYFVLEAFTLCAPDAFRNAAARETGVRRVDRRFGGALMQILIGCGALACCAYLILKRDGTFCLLNDISRLACCALLIIIEHTFEERMYALGRPMDGALLAWISNLLLAAGIFVTGKNDLILLILTGLAVLISLITSLFVAPFKSFSLVPRNYGFSPRAIVQTLLYPAVAAAGMNFFGIDLPHALAGWILWRLARTVCRRSQDESLPMNLLLIAVCAVAVGLSVFFPVAVPYAYACLAALLCAVIVFLAPSMRLYVGTVLLLLAAAELNFGFLPENARTAALVLPALAVVLNLKNALRKKVRA